MGPVMDRCTKEGEADGDDKGEEEEEEEVWPPFLD